MHDRQQIILYSVRIGVLLFLIPGYPHGCLSCDYVIHPFYSFESRCCTVLGIDARQIGSAVYVRISLRQNGTAHKNILRKTLEAILVLVMCVSCLHPLLWDAVIDACVVPCSVFCAIEERRLTFNRAMHRGLGKT